MVQFALKPSSMTSYQRFFEQIFQGTMHYDTIGHLLRVRIRLGPLGIS